MKIFGIGWHKTATHSLQEALNYLGFPGHHYYYALYHQMLDGQKRLDLRENNFSLTDFPVPLFFRELDQMYPNSKFILTRRDTCNWLKSVQTHFEIMGSPREELGGLSEHDYNSRNGIPNNEIHIYAYGQKDFDAELFAKRYEKHNEEVLDYFKSRPEDLLIMNMSEGDGWQKLCNFLNVPVPDVAYPHKYRAENRLKGVSHNDA